MSLKDDVIKQVDEFFEGDYEITEGRKVPDVEDINFGKFGTELELAMMFIDLKESTKILDAFRRQTGAKMYKSFLFGVVKIARENGGELRSFNGDGVLTAFYGDTKCTHAAKAALQLSWFVSKIMGPKLEKYFDDNQQFEDTFKLECGIGIDVGDILVVRGGTRGENNNDLVWVGNATNYAVKLAAESRRNDYTVNISDTVYSRLMDSSKLNGETDMWTKLQWTRTNNPIYGSRWTWALS